MFWPWEQFFRQKELHNCIDQSCQFCHPCHQLTVCFRLVNFSEHNLIEESKHAKFPRSAKSAGFQVCVSTFVSYRFHPSFILMANNLIPKLPIDLTLDGVRAKQYQDLSVYSNMMNMIQMTSKECLTRSKSIVSFRLIKHEDCTFSFIEHRNTTALKLCSFQKVKLK